MYSYVCKTKPEVIEVTVLKTRWLGTHCDQAEGLEHIVINHEITQQLWSNQILMNSLGTNQDYEPNSNQISYLRSYCDQIRGHGTHG